ncbi:MAG: hypothetical protein BMS9Abin05_2347 [Rhodothermia bacterium]|nr:MAG: hypothetical protein BMS9Abin05_2347 [Rhodothermia bacterium]
MSTDILNVLDHIRGPLRGSRQVLTSQLHTIGTGEDAFIHFPAHRVSDVQPRHATLTKEGDTYQIRAEVDAHILVNGTRVTEQILEHGDLIRLGETGPLLRYRHVAGPTGKQAIQSGTSASKSMKEVLDDCVEGARAETSSGIRQGLIVLRNLPKDIKTQSSPMVKIMSLGSVVIVVLLLGLITVRLSSLETQLNAQAKEMAETLGLFERDNQLTGVELRQMRDDLLSTADQLSRLKNESGIESLVIQQAMRSIVFVQASYGFSDPNGQMLRAVVGVDGTPLRDTRGQMIPTFGGKGPILERQLTGTAFVASSDGLLLTNRHVAEPWLYDESAKSAISRGFSPVVIRMIGFLPDSSVPFDISLIEASSSADVAVLRCSGITTEVPYLELAESPPELGQSVLVLGYPTGIRALLARTAPTVLDSLVKIQPEPDFWQMASILAGGGYVAPLITRGIVGQITPSAVVYDAETTHGGSGGPVIGLDGKVVAVNAAIMRDFGGSNLGVPASAARDLILPHLPQTDR